METVMPLEKAASGTPGFKRNIETEMKAGKPQKQAVAIAYNKSREDDAVSASQPLVGMPDNNHLQLPRMSVNMSDVVDAVRKALDDDDDGDLIIKHLSDTDKERFHAACDRADSISNRLDQLERRDAIKGIPK